MVFMTWMELKNLLESKAPATWQLETPDGVILLVRVPDTNSVCFSDDNAKPYGPILMKAPCQFVACAGDNVWYNLKGGFYLGYKLPTSCTEVDDNKFQMLVSLAESK